MQSLREVASFPGSPCASTALAGPGNEAILEVVGTCTHHLSSVLDSDGLKPVQGVEGMVLVHKLQNVCYACEEARAKPPCLECSCHHQRNDNTATLGVQYSGKLSREKTLAKFAILWLFAKVFSAEASKPRKFSPRIFHQFAKVFSTKFGDVASFGAAEASNLRKFLHKNRIFHQFAKVFFFESFPLCTLF